jgi:hypothetical protein
MTTSFGTSINNILTGSNLISAEFVRIDIPGTEAQGGPTFFFSNSYRNETITDPIGNTAPVTTSTQACTALGGLVAVSGHQRDLSVTSYDTSITLSGIDNTRVGAIIDAGIKGSRIQIYRGFYDTAYQIIDTPQLRYTGIVTSYSLNEERVDNIDAFTLVINCSSYKTVLENRIAGRYTNSRSWKFYNSTDTSMDRVASLSNAKFDFGKKLG